MNKNVLRNPDLYNAFKQLIEYATDLTKHAEADPNSEAVVGIEKIKAYYDDTKEVLDIAIPAVQLVREIHQVLPTFVNSTELNKGYSVTLTGAQIQSILKIVADVNQ